MSGPLSRHPDAPATRAPSLRGAVTAPISPTFDPAFDRSFNPQPGPPSIDFGLLTDALARLQGSIRHIGRMVAPMAPALANEVDYAADTIAAIRVIIGGGR